LQPGSVIMDEIDLELLALVQEGFPLTSRPFRDLGENLGLSEDEVMARIEGLQSLGLIRRIGPIMDLRKLGMLAALQVSIERADEVARVVNQYSEVSHNYLRPNENGYNLWFTVSAKEGRIWEILEEIKTQTGCKMLVLPTGKIFKIGVKFDII
jgi:DNA-binding Lrp family transcriptional regulator